MRIIGGTLAGRRFTAPSRIKARPTTDFAKQGLFNSLESSINFENATVLDLFSGLGGISLEFLSRGAVVTSIDKNDHAVAWQRSICAEFRLSNWTIKRAEALQWIAKNQEAFDIVFADPPFDFADYDSLTKALLLVPPATQSLLVIEHRSKSTLNHLAGWVSERTYGEVRFSIFKR